MKKSLQNVKRKVLDTIDQDKSDFSDFLRQLVQTPSTIGKEKEIQLIMAEKMREIGLQVDMWEPDLDELKKHPAFNPYPEILELGYKNRPVVVGTISGSGGGKSLILNGHVDVVTPEPVSQWKYDPWSGHVEGDTLIGIGTVDMKGGVASVLMAVAALQRSGFRPSGDICVESVIDEEHGGAGTLACILKGYRSDAAIVAEPTDLRAVIAHAGVMRFEIEVTGRAGHPVSEAKGVNAIDKAIKIYEALKDFHEYRRMSSSHPLFRSQGLRSIVPVDVCTMRAGVWRSTIPAEAKMSCRIGLLPGEDFGVVETHLRKWIKSASKEDSWLRSHLPKIRRIASNEAAEIDPGEPIVDTLARAYREILGNDPEVTSMSTACDMRLLLKDAQIPTVVFGPGSMGKAHSSNESISLSEVVKAAKIIAVSVLLWCE